MTNTDVNSNAANRDSYAPSSEHINTCLNKLRVLREAITAFLLTLAQHKTDDDMAVGEKRKDCSQSESRLQQLLDDILRNIKMLQSEISSLTPASGSSSAQSNLDLLALDPSSEKQQLHHQIRQCYIWMDKVANYASTCHGLISQNHNKKRRASASFNVSVATQQVDGVIMNISKQFQDMFLIVNRPMGSNAVIQVTLGHVLKGVVILRGLLVESVVIRSYSESNVDQHGKVDLFRPSHYMVFQTITDSATAAMMHFYSPYLPEISIKSFFTWLHSYINLFSEPCSKCCNTVSNNSPPTWRDFRTLRPYHQHCKP